MKARTRWALEHTPAEKLDDEARRQIEAALAEVKLEKIQDVGVDERKCLTHEQIEKLIAAAARKAPRMALLIEFLAFSGTRISETLDILVSDVRLGVDEATGEQVARILLHGKGSKDRSIIVKADLVRRIRTAFDSRRYLFGHNDRAYTREYVSMWIYRLSAKVLHKPVSAHALRHSWFTNRLHEDPGLLKEISSYGGHASTSTTVDLYLHGSFKARDVLARFHDYSPGKGATA